MMSSFAAAVTDVLQQRCQSNGAAEEPSLSSSSSCTPPSFTSPPPPCNLHGSPFRLTGYYKKLSNDDKAFAQLALEVFCFAALLYACVALISGWPLFPSLLVPDGPYGSWEHPPPPAALEGFDPYGPRYHHDQPQLRFSACEMPSSPSGDKIFSLCFGHSLCALADSTWLDTPSILQLDIAQHRMDQLMAAVSQQLRQEVGEGNQEALITRLLAIPLVCDKLVLTDEELMTAQQRTHSFGQRAMSEAPATGSAGGGGWT
eukprot:GHVS01034521.1.p1 GENE.GHVS01034521.1~~GHVS01034521.1.p1  ORF type:complete len:259 (+),score=80.47 GHVS01034521.1:78-854(+)